MRLRGRGHAWECGGRHRHACRRCHELAGIEPADCGARDDAPPPGPPGQGSALFPGPPGVAFLTFLPTCLTQVLLHSDVVARGRDRGLAGHGSDVVSSYRNEEGGFFSH